MTLVKDALPRDANYVPIQDSVGRILGIPYVGNIFYVDGTNGSDTTGTGRTPSTALATVTAAYALTTNNNHDVIIIVPGASPGRTTEVASIIWANNFTHLIGNAAPIYNAPRAGVSFSSAATSPCLTISGIGCIFKNLTITTAADLNVLVSLTGARNYFNGVAFLSTNEVAGNDTAYRIVAFDSGDGENLFDGCTFGYDSTPRTAANYTLGFEGGYGNPRNIFKNCVFTIYADADAPRHAIVAHGSCDRYAYFENCLFTCNSDTTPPVVLTDVFETDVCGDQGGVFILKDCIQIGHTGWASQLTGVRLLGASNNSTVLTNYSTGVNPTA
jgi:hypothetical protein